MFIFFVYKKNKEAHVFARPFKGEVPFLFFWDLPCPLFNFFEGGPFLIFGALRAPIFILVRYFFGGGGWIIYFIYKNLTKKNKKVKLKTLGMFKNFNYKNFIIKILILKYFNFKIF